MPTAFIVIALIIAACAALGVLLSELAGVSRVDGYLATTPGGLPAVLAATTSTGGDITFVSTVQLLRIIIGLVVTPFFCPPDLRSTRPSLTTSPNASQRQLKLVGRGS